MGCAADKGGAGRGVSPVLHDLREETWGYGLRRSSKTLAAVRGLPLLFRFFDFLYLLPAKAVVTRMGGDGLNGSVSWRVRRGAPIWAHLPKMFLLERKDSESYSEGGK